MSSSSHRRPRAIDATRSARFSARIGHLLGAFGAKSDKDLLAGMLSMLEGDEIAVASGLWRPLRVTPSALAIACRKLIAIATFPPRPAELHAACREASRSLKSAHDVCEGLCDYVRRCDAVLLEFAPDEWRRPYLTAQYQPIVERMLDLHHIYGDGTDDYDWNRPSAILDAVQRERANLTLPKPEHSPPRQQTDGEAGDE